MELTFKQEKDTKNTVRYQEQSEGDIVIGPLYVQKSALGETPPAELSIWIDLGDEEDSADERYEAEELSDCEAVEEKLEAVEEKLETVEESA